MSISDISASSENEIRKQIEEEIKIPAMLDPQRAEGSFIAWGFFMILIISIGAVTCHLSTTPPTFKAMLLFTNFMLILLAASLTSNIRNRQAIMRLLSTGKNTVAAVISRREVKSRGSLLPFYFYTLKFDAQKNGKFTQTRVRLPQKITDMYKVGDSLNILYEEKNPRVCMEEISENIRKDLLSKRTEGKIFAIGLICLCITFWGISGTVFESMAQTFPGTSLNQYGYTFMKLMLSHPSDRLSLEILLIVMSLAVMGCGLYFLLSPIPQKTPAQDR